MEAIAELTSTRDQYKVIGVSTAHLTTSDMLELTAISFSDTGNSMVFSRDSGFIQKLFKEQEYNTNPSMSDSYNHILKTIHEAGFLMVEFDSAAEIHSCFQEFEHDEDGEIA